VIRSIAGKWDWQALIRPTATGITSVAMLGATLPCPIGLYRANHRCRQRQCRTLWRPLGPLPKPPARQDLQAVLSASAVAAF